MNVETMNKKSFSKLYMQELLIKTAYTGSFRKLCPYIIYYLPPLRSPEKDLYACTGNPRKGYHLSDHLLHPRAWRWWAFEKEKEKDLSILQYDVIILSPDFLRKLRGFSKSFAYVGSVAKGNKG